MHARGLSTHRMHTRSVSHDILAIADETAEKSQSHGAAANVACTDKENVFHGAKARPRQSKIKLGQVNAMTSFSLTTPAYP